MQSDLRTYTNALLPRHVRKPRQMQLMRNGDRLRRPVPVLAQDQVGLAATRIVTLEGIWTVQQDYHIGILFQGIMKTD